MGALVGSLRSGEANSGARGTRFASFRISGPERHTIADLKSLSLEFGRGLPNGL